MTIPHSSLLKDSLGILLTDPLNHKGKRANTWDQNRECIESRNKIRVEKVENLTTWIHVELILRSSVSLVTFIYIFYIHYFELNQICLLTTSHIQVRTLGAGGPSYIKRVNNSSDHSHESGHDATTGAQRLPTFQIFALVAFT